MFKGGKKEQLEASPLTLFLYTSTNSNYTMHCYEVVILRAFPLLTISLGFAYTLDKKKKKL